MFLPAVFAVGVAFLLISLATRGGASASSSTPAAPAELRPPQAPAPAPPGPAMPPALQDALRKMMEGVPLSPDELDHAASEAEDAGHAKTADELRDQADTERAVRAGDSALPALLPSPIPKAATNEQWSAFVHRLAPFALNARSAGNMYGAFGLQPRELQAAGLMRNAQWDGQRWNGEWVKPYSQEQFGASASLQYEAFLAVMKPRLAHVLKHYKVDALAETEGKPVTLSGLAGVAFQWGTQALDSWVLEPGKRKPRTTATFLRTTGIF